MVLAWCLPTLTSDPGPICLALQVEATKHWLHPTRFFIWVFVQLFGWFPIVLRTGRDAVTGLSAGMLEMELLCRLIAELCFVTLK